MNLKAISVYMQRPHRIAVYHEPITADSKPTLYVNPFRAAEYIGRGFAKWIEGFGIVVTKQTQANSATSLRCSQEETYERAAILPKTPFIPGGLTRNEHQPVKFSRFKAARVGH